MIPIEAIKIFGIGTEIEECDLYDITYAKHKISKIDRKKLKEIGFKLQRHTRTNREIWVFDKVK